MTETPGATRSGFVKRFGIEAAPRPEKSAGVFVFASQAPTVITELAEDGTVSVLYGEQLKAWLIAGAKELPGYPVPNPRTGWGALCLEAAFR